MKARKGQWAEERKPTAEELKAAEEPELVKSASIRRRQFFIFVCMELKKTSKDYQTSKFDEK